MVTSHEERQGEETQEPAPVAVRPAELAPAAVPDLEMTSPAVDEALLQGGSITAELDATNAEDASEAPMERSAIPEPPHASPDQALVDPAASEEISEDEATGRRVESLLAEAPDAHPEGPLPARGEFLPMEFAAPAAFDPTQDDPDAPPAPPAQSTFRDAVLNRSGMDRVGPIIAFDFDGTLTVRDSFTAFLKWREGSGRYHAEMAALAPAALKYLFDRDPGKLKAAAVRRFLQGLPRKVLNEEAAEFAALAAPLLFRPDALKAWRRYRQDGARLVIVTASPENIVAPFARGLGADLLLATQLLFDEEDRVQGGLLGDNCRGPEKVRRLKRALGPDVVLAAAYGDTDGDWEMLDMAEQQFMRLFVGVPGKPGGPG